MSDSATRGPDPFGALMRAAQDGDGTAYTVLLEELVPLLRRVVGARGGFPDAADVEDVVQEVLISVHAVRATYDPERPFLPWLLAITRNRIADARRKHRRGATREVTLDHPDVTSVQQPTNAATAGLEDRDALLRAIGELPPSQREAVTLLKLRELSLREASAESGMTIGSLKVATHRAMVTLRRLMKGSQGDA